MIKITKIKISDVNFNDKSYIFRHSFDVSDLENSIKYEGLLYPPILITKPSDRYTIISGYRRLLACRNLEMTEVPCIVHEEKALEKEELLKISIAENTKRQALKPIEIAEALLRIKDELQLTIDELAAQFGNTFGIGSSKDRIEKYLKLNLFDNETKDFLGKSNVKNIEFALANVESPKNRNELINIVKKTENIKPSHINQIIDNVNKIEKKQEKTGYKKVFEDNALKNILDNDEISGSKKINSFLCELENIADPEHVKKLESFSQQQNKLMEKLKEEGLEKKVSIKKTSWEDPSLRIMLDINSVKDFISITKILYETRKNILTNLLKV